jgi:hypothetical protein
MDYLDSIIGNTTSNTKKKQTYTYSKENSLLKMIAIPSFGVYSPNYSFYIPFNILYHEKITQNIFNSFPDLMRQHVNDLHNKFKVKFDYFVISLDGGFIHSKYKHNTHEGFLRVNYVAHPYIFYDISNLSKDHNSYMLSALYTNLGDSDSYIKEINEESGLKINPEIFLHDMNKKEIILHKSNDNFPALSPNNCAILVNLNLSFFSFYNITAVFYDNKIVKFCVTQFNIFNRNDFLLINPLINSLNKSAIINNENVKKVLFDLVYNKHMVIFILNTLFGYICTKIQNLENEKEILEMIKNILNLTHIKAKFENNKINYGNLNIQDILGNYEMIDELRSAGIILEEENLYEFESIGGINSIIGDKNINMLDHYYNEFCNFVSDFLGRIKIKNFTEKILFSKNNYKKEELKDSKNTGGENFNLQIRNKFIIQVILKFLRHKINSLDKIIQSYFIIINEIDSTVQYKVEDFYSDVESILLSQRGK